MSIILLHLKNTAMTTLQKTVCIILGFCFSHLATGQQDAEQTNLAGDHFSLEGTLEAFKKANDLEAFEKLINEKDNGINNLDLNEDGDVDYIHVADNSDGDVHAIVLYVAVSDSERQDVAVIEVEKTGNERADLQIIGDADIFGEETIVEAVDEKESQDRSGKGPSYNHQNAITYVVVNVWSWATVRYIYNPSYRPYVSPWRWRYYPTWHRPWRPLSWSVFHPIRTRYVGYRIASTHRVVRAHKVYTPVRRYHKPLHNYRVTRTTKTTKVTGPKGNTHVKKETKTKVTKNTRPRGRKG
jgi:hypothetical protein